MADITYRRVKGSPLTNDEVDDNFVALNEQLESLNKESLGLDLVDNTSDMDKPVSEAQLKKIQAVHSIVEDNQFILDGIPSENSLDTPKQSFMIYRGTIHSLGDQNV